MCNKFTVLSLAYVVVFVSTVVKCDKDAGVADYFSKDVNAGRTFGHNALKRLSFIFLPVMFTLGVISTLMLALAVISVKNLAIGVILLIVAISQSRGCSWLLLEQLLLCIFTLVLSFYQRRLSQHPGPHLAHYSRLGRDPTPNILSPIKEKYTIV